MIESNIVVEWHVDQPGGPPSMWDGGLSLLGYVRVLISI